MTRLRALLLAEAANPEWVSVPLEGWSHATALMDVVDGHLVTQIRNEEAILRAGLPRDRFTAIDSERVAAPLYKIAERLRGGEGKGWTTVTAVASLAYRYYERVVWRRFGADIRAKKFDVVHRITPLSPTAPSSLAAKCRRAGVPFVMGPLNGGVPWPREFDAARRKEREWLSYVRGAYKLLPGRGATLRHASAIVAGSLATLSEIPRRHRGKCVYIAENAVDPARFTRARTTPATSPLRIAFVGRLVPYKCADVLVEAAAPLVRAGRAVVDVIGDGPEMSRLVARVEELGLKDGVRLPGWIDHRSLQDRLVESSVFAFPSIREFGGAVVLEAMALGLVPIVVNYGGPGELVTDETGVRVPLGDRANLVAGFRSALERFAADPSSLDAIGARARRRVFNLFTWPAKARQTLEVYRWATAERPDRPEFGLVDPSILRPLLEPR